MSNAHVVPAPVKVGNVRLEVVDHYLRQTIQEVGDGTDAAAESWRGGAMDLALIELEEPFGAAARTRPILMATAGGECAGGAAAQCHVSRALPRATDPRRARVRIEAARLAPPERCAAAAPHWSAVRDRALCLVGPEFCASDWGGGVVCGGKLCGVLSRSVRSAAAPTRDGRGDDNSVAGDDCGDTHVAQSVSLWRRFLHCAHTLRACGRGGDCADLCVERRLVEEPAAAPASEAPRAPAARPTTARRPTTTTLGVFYYPTRSNKPRGTPPSRPTPTRSTTHRTGHGARASFGAVLAHTSAHGYSPMLAHGPIPTLAAVPAPTPLPVVVAVADAPASPRPSFEFEPNRADFKAASAPSASRSTRAYLKAGEYGDNAAEYGGEEPGAPPTRTDAPPTPAAPPTPLAPPADTAPPVERRGAPTARPRARATRPHPLAVLILVPFIYIFMAI